MLTAVAILCAAFAAFIVLRMITMRDRLSDGDLAGGAIFLTGLAVIGGLAWWLA